MTLKEYNKKRNFRKTIEPKASLKKSKSENPLFVIQEHDASHLHWDFRLEIEGILKSWALPKKPPKTKETKRLAIETEDHPISYAVFEGIIPKGQYGAGKVKIWDNGTYEMIEHTKDKLEFKLKGKKLKGKYVLIKTKYGKDKKSQNKSWLFFKI